MNIGLKLLTDNVGMSFEHILLLAIVIGSLIFYAVKFELGNALLMFSSGAVFIWMYMGGYNYTYALIVLFISIIFMAISLLQQRSSGVVLQ